MSKINKIILFYILFLLLPLNSYSSKEVIVGINRYYPPHEFFENNKAKGFNVDILKAISEKINLKIKFIPVNEENSYSLLRAGNIDILAMSGNKNRLQYFDFTELSILDLSLALFTKSDIYNITDINDLINHTVAVEKNDVSHEYLKNQTKNVIIIHVADQEEAFKLLQSGEVFAYFGNKFTGLYLLQKFKTGNIKIIGKSISIEPRIFAVQKDNVQLRNLLDRGIEIIKKNNTYSRIYKKWFGYSFKNVIRKRATTHTVLMICVILIITTILLLILHGYIKKIEQKKITKLEFKYENFINRMNTGIICFDSMNKIILINPKMSNWMNMEGKDLLYKTLNEISELKDNKEELLQLLKSIHKGEETIWKHFSLKINNQEFIFSVSGFEIVDEHDKNVSTLVFSDISIQEKLREQLSQSQKMEALGRLIEGISHDFNNILTGIMSSIEMINESKYLDKRLRPDLKLVDKFSNKAKELTEKLLILSKKQTHSPMAVNLNDLLLNIQSILKRLTRENIDINFILNDNLKLIQIDPAQFEHVLINLVINATEAIPDEGEIQIKTKNVIIDENHYVRQSIAKAGEYVLLEFSDTGIGMDQKVLQHIFEPFFTTKKYIGSGLGLAMVQGIIEQNNGFINVESKKRQGASFKIYFPVLREKKVHISTYDKAIQQKKVTAKIKGKNIFIVEDDDELRDLLHKYLSQLGAVVRSSGSWEEILSLLDNIKNKTPKIKIDLLLTDVVLPRIDGKQLAEKIKEKFPNLKVVFMSGYSDKIIKLHGLTMEDMNFLQKPFDLQTLLKVIKNTL